MARIKRPCRLDRLAAGADVAHAANRFLYWRERFRAGDQWVYSLINASVGEAVAI
jgi:hypothetical protein